MESVVLNPSKTRLMGLLKAYRHIWLCYGLLETVCSLGVIEELEDGRIIVQRSLWNDYPKFFSTPHKASLDQIIMQYQDVAWVYVQPTRLDGFVVEFKKIDYKSTFCRINRMLQEQAWKPNTRLRWVTRSNWGGARRTIRNFVFRPPTDMAKRAE